MRYGKGTLIDAEFDVDEKITKLHYDDLCDELKKIREAAKPNLERWCKLCPTCNGVSCPGFSPEGRGTFVRNVKKLQELKISYETVYEGGNGTEIDTRVTLFGRKFRAPIASAPFGMIGNFNPSTHYPDDYEFNKDLIMGTHAVGCFSFTPDTFGPLSYTDPLRAIRDCGFPAIPTIKSWEKQEVQDKIRMADEAGVFAIAHDIDCIGLGNKSVNGGRDTFPRSAAQLKELFSITKTPYILKGINSVKSALAAVDSGASGIVVSNHGGNCTPEALATSETLPLIRDAVGNRLTIFVDGGVRTGQDVFKLLALGADIVIVGRPFIHYAEGGGAKGVAMYAQKLVWELMNTMRMSGCRILADITRDHVIRTDG